MKAFPTLTLLAAGAVAILTLGSCSQATATTTTSTARPFTTASADIGVGLTFEDGKGLFVSNYNSTAFSVVEDKGTNGTYVLSIPTTGNYEHAVYTLPATTDFTTSKTLKIDLKTPSTDGTVLVLTDTSGNQYFYWIAGTGAWVTSTLTISTGGITDGTNYGWQGSSSKPADLTKIASFEITGNEHVETILADNISLK